MEPQLQYSQFFASMGHQLEKLWQEMGIPQKIALIGTTCILAAILIFSVVSATSSGYTLLYPKDQLLPADAAEVRTFLDKHQIDYQIDGSTAILIPAESAPKVRMELSAAGLPKQHSNKGFDLFDSNSWIEGDKKIRLYLSDQERIAARTWLEKEGITSENILLVINPGPLTAPRNAGCLSALGR